MTVDARAGKTDFIITKSISRFERNTDTFLKAVLELKNLGIGVFFELQHIITLEASGEQIDAFLSFRIKSSMEESYPCSLIRST